MTDQMRYVEIDGFGGPEVLRPASGPVPAPGPGEVLIEVAAAGVNRPDVLQRSGNYPVPPGASPLPGLEVAGKIAALGEGCERYEIGDAVCALTPGGGYAEFCIAPERNALPVPGGLSMTEAAAVPETFFTVWHNVFERGRLSDGERFLVHGGSSGIGTTAIQLAAARGAEVYCTVGGADKAKACEELGAKRAINYKDEDFVAVIDEATDGKGVDLILDMVGGSYVTRNIKSLAMEGRLVQIAWLGGSKVEANFAQLMLKRLTWTGSTLRPQSVDAKARIADALEAEVWPLLAEGKVKPLLFKTFPLDKAADAHALMESSTHIGKIVLETGRG